MSESDREFYENRIGKMADLQYQAGMYQSLYEVAMERNARLIAALEEIAEMCPASAEMTVAHAMAQVANEALAR